MVLSIAVIVFVGVVAYFNFAQGFFSATLSAVSAVLAAVLAVSYDEPVVRSVVKGGMADVSHAVVMVVLFVAGYAFLRVIFDKLIPGNVRVPATINAVGAGLMGLVAGVFSIGVLVIAIQMLPFGPRMSLMGYTRFKMLPPHDVILPSTNGYASKDAHIDYQMADDTLDPAKQESTLFVPVDSAVLSVVDHLSDGGSLAGSRPLATVHPDWLAELYGERLGQQTGNRRSALPVNGNDSVTVAGVYRPTLLPTYDGYGPNQKTASETGQIRPPGYKMPYAAGLKPEGDKIPLVVRVHVASNATDDADHLFRFSPGTVRLTVRPDLPDGSFGRGTDYYPVGMLDGGKLAVINRADDFLFLDLSNGDGSFDAVFMVPKDTLVAGKGNGAAVAPGTFLTVKRLAVTDLSDMPVEDAVPPDPKVAVLRTDFLKSVMPGGSATK